MHNICCQLLLAINNRWHSSPTSLRHFIAFNVTIASLCRWMQIVTVNGTLKIQKSTENWKCTKSRFTSELVLEVINAVTAFRWEESEWPKQWFKTYVPTEMKLGNLIFSYVVKGVILHHVTNVISIISKSAFSEN